MSFLKAVGHMEKFKDQTNKFMNNTKVYKKESVSENYYTHKYIF